MGQPCYEDKIQELNTDFPRSVFLLNPLWPLTVINWFHVTSIIYFITESFNVLYDPMVFEKVSFNIINSVQVSFSQDISITSE